MAARTLKFFGSASGGPGQIFITAKINNNIMYSGTIPTEYSSISVLTQDQMVLFTCEVPMDFAGTYPMIVYLDSSVAATVHFAEIKSNYMRIPRTVAVYTPAQEEILNNPGATRSEKVAVAIECAVPPLTQEEIATLNSTDPTVGPTQRDIIIAHNLSRYVSSKSDTWYAVNGSSDPRSNVVINGVSAARGADPAGTWGWSVSFSGQTQGVIAYDLTVDSGQAN